MKLGLIIGKWGLILIIWILILLTLNGGIDSMTLIQFSLGLLYTITIVTVAFAVFNFDYFRTKTLLLLDSTV